MNDIYTANVISSYTSEIVVQEGFLARHKAAQKAREAEYAPEQIPAYYDAIEHRMKSCLEWAGAASVEVTVDGNVWTVDKVKRHGRTKSAYKKNGKRCKAEDLHLYGLTEAYRAGISATFWRAGRVVTPWRVDLIKQIEKKIAILEVALKALSA